MTYRIQTPPHNKGEIVLQTTILVFAGFGEGLDDGVAIICRLATFYAVNVEKFAMK